MIRIRWLKIIYNKKIGSRINKNVFIYIRNILISL